MSASVADAITLERRGIPAAILAVDLLANTIGRAMARAQGAPDFPIAMVRAEDAPTEQPDSVNQLDALAATLVTQVESIALGQR